METSESRSARYIRSATLISLLGILVFVVFILFGLKSGSVFELKLNEWGDVFAGFFAPLAFIWVAMAVLIQREELRNQVFELKLSRYAHEHQVKEYAKSVLEFAKQSDILSKQLEFAVEERNLSIFISEIRILFSDYITFSTYVPKLKSRYVVVDGVYRSGGRRSDIQEYEFLGRKDEVFRELNARNVIGAFAIVSEEIHSTRELIEKDKTILLQEQRDARAFVFIDEFAYKLRTLVMRNRDEKNVDVREIVINIINMRIFELLEEFTKFAYSEHERRNP
jgi:hypothetical protein